MSLTAQDPSVDEIESYLLQQLNWRYATKKFDPAKKLSQKQLAKLEEAVRLAPSSYGLQPYRVFIISDPPTREKLRAAAWKQPQVTDASQIVIFAARTEMTEDDIDEFVALNTEVRGVSTESLKQYRDTMVGDVVKGPRSAAAAHWTASQAYIGLGFLLTTAALLQIDACPMEGFDPEKFDEILGLKTQGLHATVMCALGYRAADDWLSSVAKVRKPHHDLIQHI